MVVAQSASSLRLILTRASPTSHGVRLVRGALGASECLSLLVSSDVSPIAGARVERKGLRPSPVLWSFLDSREYSVSRERAFGDLPIF